MVHSAAMLDSVLEHSGALDVHVHYMHGAELPAGSREPLTRMVEAKGGKISFVDVPDDLSAGLPTEGFTRKATWYRVLAADLLPQVDRILFLDADVVVMDSLEPLWATDLAGHYLAAVTNVFQADHLGHPPQIGLDRPELYFNAGVLLMDLELMRRDGCAEKMRRYGVEHADELALRDQDALNVVLSDRRLPLDPRWNVMNSFFAYPWSSYVFGSAAVEDAKGRPGVRHYEGPAWNKPWHDDYPFPHKEPYFEHRRATPWPDVEVVGKIGPARKLARRVRRRLSA